MGMCRQSLFIVIGTQLTCARTVLFLRGYSLKRIVRQAGDPAAETAESEAQAKLAAAAPVAGVESGDALAKDDAATVRNDPSINEDEKTRESPRVDV